jgi:hypothetical protein
MILRVLFVSGLLRPLQKQKWCNNEEVLSSYERENGFNKWPKEGRNRVNRRNNLRF